MDLQDFLDQIDNLLVLRNRCLCVKEGLDVAVVSSDQLDSLVGPEESDLREALILLDREPAHTAFDHRRHGAILLDPELAPKTPPRTPVGELGLERVSPYS